MRSYLIILLVCCVVSASGQSLDEMRRAQSEAQAKIAELAAELKKTESSQRDAQKELDLLRSKIKQRQKMLASIEGQLRLVDDQLGVLGFERTASAAQLDQAVALYCSVVETYAAALRTCPRWGVHSARMRYYTRTVSDTLAARALVLKKMGADLTAQAMTLSERRIETLRLRADHKAELEAVGSETKQAERLAAELASSAQTLSEQQQEHQKVVDALEAQIRSIVAKEVARTAGNKQLTSALAGLSKDFVNNKGRLPNPLAWGGKLSGRYGMQQVQKGVSVQNNGINLVSTGGDGRVVAVFSGTVSRVFAIMGLGQCVLLRHGSYFTVYSGLEVASVVAGQQVAAGDLVGRVAQGGTLHFELWSGSTPVDPTPWIKL